eukprot:7444981-Prorocentrum_lima.AAC.1
MALSAGGPPLRRAMALGTGGKQSTLPLSSEVQWRLPKVANNQPCHSLSSKVQWRLAQAAR